MQLLSIRSSVVTIVCKFAMQSSLWPSRGQTLIVGLPDRSQLCLHSFGKLVKHFVLQFR